MTAPIQKIHELFADNIYRNIPAVVVVSNEDTLAAEVEEYVVTPSIRQAFHSLIRTFIAMQNAPTQAIGVWVSGFFGSGKSSFAKTFGYALSNPEIQLEDGTRQRVRDVLLGRFQNDQETTELFDQLSQVQRPTHVIIFDLSQEASTGDMAISPIAYRLLLRHFGYSAHLQVAELELQLEREGRMEPFRAEYQKQKGREWGNVGVAFALNQASAVMHALEPQTFSAPDSWAKAQATAQMQVTPKLLADRALEMAERRGNGANVVFVVDEVGQYASRSVDRMLDLQGILHAFDGGGSSELPLDSGVERGSGRGRLWFVATAQEQLSAVVENLDEFRSELGRLMDRFQQPIDLKPQDIATVTTERLLKKSGRAATQLRELFGKNASTLKLRSSPETNTPVQLDETSFVNLYPLLPYQFDLIIEIIAKIRQSGQVASTFGAAVRPVLSMSQMLLKDKGLGIGEGDVGQLVRFDQVYDQLDNEGKIPAEDRDAVNELKGRLQGELAVDALRVAKALVLVGYTRQSTFRTLKTLSALTYPGVAEPAQDARVRDALALLIDERFVSEVEGNYKFLSREGRTWEEERAQIDPGTRVRARYRDELGKALGSSAPYNHSNLRTFRPTLWIKGNRVPGSGQGDIDLRLDINATENETFRESQTHAEAVVGRVEMGRDAETAARNVLRSEEMIRRHGQDSNYAAQVMAERKRQAQQESVLETEAEKALLRGQYFFNGDELRLPDQPSLGKLNEYLFQRVVPNLYKFIGRVTISPKLPDFDKLFSLPTLSSSSALLGPGGLNVSQMENGQQVIKAQAPVLQDVSEFIRKQHKEGMTVTGRELEDHFEGQPFGYSSERLRYLLAVLLRAGQLEVQAAGRTISSYNDEGALAAFTNLPAFRQAQFALRAGALGTSDLLEISQKLNDLTGRSKFSVEEGELGRRIREELRPLLTRADSVLQTLQSNHLPIDARLDDARTALQNVVSADNNEKVVHAYRQNSQTLRDTNDAFQQLDSFLNADRLRELAEARTALNRYAPALPEQTENATALQALLEQTDFYQQHSQIRDITRTLEGAWQAHYAQPWHARHQAYQDAAQQLRATPSFNQLEADIAESFAQQLTQYSGAPEPAESNWRQISPNIEHLQADIAAAQGRLIQTTTAMKAALPPSPVPLPTEIRVRRLQLDPTNLEAATSQLDAYLAALRQRVLEALERGDHVVVE